MDNTPASRLDRTTPASAATTATSATRSLHASSTPATQLRDRIQAMEAELQVSRVARGHARNADVSPLHTHRLQLPSLAPYSAQPSCTFVIQDSSPWWLLPCGGVPHEYAFVWFYALGSLRIRPAPQQRTHGRGKPRGWRRRSAAEAFRVARAHGSSRTSPHDSLSHHPVCTGVRCPLGECGDVGPPGLVDFLIAVTIVRRIRQRQRRLCRCLYELTHTAARLPSTQQRLLGRDARRRSPPAAPRPRPLSRR